MREDRTLSERIAADLATVHWPAPAEIRARARQRTSARMATAGCAALIVLVASVSVLLDGRPSPVPAGEAATPTPRVSLAIPPEALLQPVDLGVDLEAREFFLQGPSLTWEDPNLDACMSSKQLGLTWTAGITRSHDVLRYRQSEDERQPGDFVLSQRVARFHAGAAEQFTEDLRRVVAACDGFVFTGPIEQNGKQIQVESRHHWTVIEGGVAGDQSLLLRSEKTVYEQGSKRFVAGPFNTLVGFVRVGDLIAVIDTGDTDAGRLRQLLGLAAARLCVAANPRC